MAVRVTDQPIQEFYGQQVTPQSSADLIAARRSLNVRSGFTEILIEPEVEVRVALCPKIVGVYWYDKSVDRWNDLLGGGGNDSEILDSARTGTATFTLDTDDFLYVGALSRFGGFRLDLDATLINDNASTLTCQYPAADGTWTALTITDGTNSSGTMAQDGNITFTVAAAPAQGAWKHETLPKLTDLGAPTDTLAYWLRFDTSALLDLVEIEDLAVFHVDMAAVLATGGGGGIFREDTEYTIDLHDNVGAIEFINIAAAATTMNVTHIRR